MFDTNIILKNIFIIYNDNCWNYKYIAIFEYLCYIVLGENMITHFKYHDTGVDNLNNKSHFHSGDLEILHIVNGEGTIVLKDKIYALNSNTVFFINGGDAHYTSPEDPQKYIRNKIIFSSELLLDLAEKLSAENLIKDLFLNGGTAVSLSIESSAKIDECFFALTEPIKSKNENFKIDFFINIFTILNIATATNNRVKNLNNKIAGIISFINQNLSQNITLDMICENANIGKSGLCRKFKSAVGTSVFKYIEFSRISLAKDLLVNTDESISNIAQKSGFESFAYFSKVFKKYENCTPSNYRKKHTNLFYW